jgi:hypothetical protein
MEMTQNKKSSSFWPNVRALFLLALVAIGSYWYHVNYQKGPCEAPIDYHIGEFDASFGVSKADFLSAIAEAEGMWKNEEGSASDKGYGVTKKPLFRLTDNSGLAINLIFDDRQKMTIQNAFLSSEIDQNANVAESVKSEFLALKERYAVALSLYNQKVSEYVAQQSAYNKKVNAANRRGGVREKEYRALSFDRDQLSADAAELQSEEENLNSLADRINTLVQKYNLIAENNNAKADIINRTAGEKFSAGEYVLDEAGERINIYQFEGRDKMIRVLAHELGHALGLEHVPDRKSVMYEMNSGTGEKLGEGDVAALRELCGAK